MAKILLLDDDKALCDVVQDWLEDKKHIVEVAHDGLEGMDLLEFSNYDLVILDINMPGMNGIEICRKMRAAGIQSMVLMLTGKDTIVDKEIGFGVGADDYLTKPFNIKELMARAQALLRRSSPLIDKTLKAGDISLDLATFTVWRDGQKIALSKIEFALLEFFMRHPKQVFSQEALLASVWPSDSEISTETVRTTLKRLRAKIDLEGKPSLIQNIHGVGYVLE